MRQDGCKLILVADARALARLAAERVLARLQPRDGRAAVCLAGGSTPKMLYELLATEPYRTGIAWDKVDWFVSDERFVPASDPLNNMHMARQSFLDCLAPSASIHPIATSAGGADEAARLYEVGLKRFYGADSLDPDRPLFDLVLMGIGSDGHVASLFPGYPAIEETGRWVTEVPQAHVEPFVPRVSLTLPALCSCHEMLFMVSGANKSAIMTRVLQGEDLPATRARASGETVWLCDKAALPGRSAEGFVEDIGGR